MGSLGTATDRGVRPHHLFFGSPQKTTHPWDVRVGRLARMAEPGQMTGDSPKTEPTAADRRLARTFGGRPRSSSVPRLCHPCYPLTYGHYLLRVS